MRAYTRHQVLAVLLTAVIAISCAGLAEGPTEARRPVEAPAAAISVSPSTEEIEAGESVQFTATVLDSTGATLVGRTVEWKSSNETGAQVTATGLVTALSGPSTSVISASAGGIVGVASLTVRPSETSTTDECAEPSPEWIWCDDFEVDRLSEYFEYDAAGGSFARVAGVGVDGTAGMRAHFAAAAVSAGALHMAMGLVPQTRFTPVDGGSEKYREIYWRMYIRHQTGWQGGGGAKLSRAFVFASPTTYAQAMIAHVWAGSPPNEHYLYIDPARGTDDEGNLVTTKYNDFENLTFLGSRRGTTPLFTQGGEWYCVEARARLNDAGLSNGVQQLWVDGNLEASRTDLNFVGDFDAYGINAVYLENYWNSGSPVAQDRFFDRFVVSRNRIGC